LPSEKYLVQPVDNVHALIQHSDVRYCNPANEQDANALAGLIQSKGFNAPTVTKIEKCDSAKTLNVLEVWLQSGG